MGGKVLDLEVRKAWDKGKEQGIEQGIEKGVSQTVLELVKEGDITIDRAAEKLNKNPDEIQKMLNEIAASERK